MTLPHAAAHLLCSFIPVSAQGFLPLIGSGATHWLDKIIEFRCCWQHDSSHNAGILRLLNGQIQAEDGFALIDLASIYHQEHHADEDMPDFGFYLDDDARNINALLRRLRCPIELDSALLLGGYNDKLPSGSHPMLNWVLNRGIPAILEPLQAVAPELKIMAGVAGVAGDEDHDDDLADHPADSLAAAMILNVLDVLEYCHRRQLDMLCYAI